MLRIKHLMKNLGIRSQKSSLSFNIIIHREKIIRIILELLMNKKEVLYKKAKKLK